MLRQRTEHQNAVDGIVLIYFLDCSNQLLLCYICGKQILLYCYTKRIATLHRTALVGDIISALAHTDNTKSRIYASCF